jgi:hypothetical protein
MKERRLYELIGLVTSRDMSTRTVSSPYIPQAQLHADKPRCWLLCLILSRANEQPPKGSPVRHVLVSTLFPRYQIQNNRTENER